MTFGSNMAIQRRTVILVSLCLAALASFADTLQSFASARLVGNQPHEGDIFLVEAGGKHVLMRLYFVDCPETSTATSTDARRVREQARYFGLPDARRVVHFGKEAEKFVAGLLAKPFTLHSAFATAPGRSTQPRVYGFITTAEGNDLATLLVQNGYARTQGLGRATPQGVSRNVMVRRLRDLELAAALRRAGIWAESDPERVAELRASQRQENHELKQRQTQKTGGAADSPTKSIDLNAATLEELQSVKGIGRVTAERIIAARPFTSVEDLKRVKGIGDKKLEQFRPHFSVSKVNEPKPGGHKSDTAPK